LADCTFAVSKAKIDLEGGLRWLVDVPDVMEKALYNAPNVKGRAKLKCIRQLTLALHINGYGMKGVKGQERYLALIAAAVGGFR